jgi:hypothetical protein
MISGGYYFASKKWQVEDQYGMNEVITKLLVRSRTDGKEIENGTNFSGNNKKNYCSCDIPRPVQIWRLPLIVVKMQVLYGLRISPLYGKKQISSMLAFSYNSAF